MKAKSLLLSIILASACVCVTVVLVVMSHWKKSDPGISYEHSGNIYFAQTPKELLEYFVEAINNNDKDGYDSLYNNNNEVTDQGFEIAKKAYVFNEYLDKRYGKNSWKKYCNLDTPISITWQLITKEDIETANIAYVNTDSAYISIETYYGNFLAIRINDSWKFKTDDNEVNNYKYRKLLNAMENGIEYGIDILKSKEAENISIEELQKKITNKIYKMIE